MRLAHLFVFMAVVPATPATATPQAAPQPAAALDTLTVQPGDVIRLRGHTPGPRIEGIVRWARNDSLGVQLFAQPETRAFARQLVADLEVRRPLPGARDRSWRATLVGAVLVGAGGYILGDRLRCRHSGAPPGQGDLSCDTGTYDHRVAYTTAGVILGAAGGWLAWGIVERPQWVPAR